MNSLRLALVGGFLTFRALFDWLSPTMFVATMLVTPLAQIYFFTIIGPAYSTWPADFFATGNAVQTCAMAGVYGVAQTIGNERMFGTLAPLLLSPANRAALYLGRALPHLAVGLGVSLAGLALATLLIDFTMPPDRWPSLVLVLLVTVTSSTAIGIPLGAMGLLGRDTTVAASAAYLGLLLISGAAVPPALMPGPIADVATFLPMTNGIAAVRHLAAHGADGTFLTLLTRELLIGAVAIGLGFLALSSIERRARHRGDFDVT